MPLSIDIVSPERVLYTGEADMVVCRTSEGEIAFLPGHVPFLACLSPGVVVRPMTIVVNKSPIEGEGRIGPITWGAAQLGIAQGVLDAVAEGLLDPAEAAEIVVLDLGGTT